MTNGIQVFNNQEFGAIRGYVDEAGTAQLNAEDIARGFGFVEVKDGREYVKWRRVNSYLSEFGFSPQVAKDDFIPENMVYRLGFKANNETAQRFQGLLADEIIPSIRKHGAYMTPEKIEEVLLNPDTIIRLATDLKEERAKRMAAENTIEIQKPKVMFADSVSASKTSILIGELAKLIKQNGIDMGQKRLFQWMRDNGYLIKRKGNDYNTPTQKSMEAGLFEIKETSIIHSDNQPIIHKTTMVTGKGQIYFINLFLKKKNKDASV